MSKNNCRSSNKIHRRLTRIKRGRRWIISSGIDAAAATQAAEEALAKTSAMSQAETMGLAMEQATGEGMNEATAGQAAQNLSALLKSAKLEAGLLQAQIPADLLSNLSGLSEAGPWPI